MIYLIILGVLLLSAFFSGSEIAFISASKLGVELRKSSGSTRGQIIGNFYKKPDRFLGIMLVGNNIALVIFTWFMEKQLSPHLAALDNYPGLYLLTTTLIITLVVLLFGEFLPKTIFRIYANSLLYAFAYPLLFFKYLFGIPAYLVTQMSNWFLRNIFRVQLPIRERVLTRVDLESFVSGKAIDTEEELEANIFINALHLQNVKARECMVPRTEVVYIDASSTNQDIIDLFKETTHSRIVVVDGDIDNVIGYVHHLQFLKNQKNLRNLVIDLPFVPESMSAKDLLVRFISNNTTIACVVDEYGGTSGLITMEDVLEEIFGEIEDEHDQEDYTEVQLNEDEYLFSGRLEIDYLNEKYNLNLPDGEYSTLSGYIVFTNEDIPDEGHEIKIGEYTFVLEVVGEKKIETVRLIRNDGEE